MRSWVQRKILGSRLRIVESWFGPARHERAELSFLNSRRTPAATLADGAIRLERTLCGKASCVPSFAPPRNPDPVSPLDAALGGRLTAARAASSLTQYC